MIVFHIILSIWKINKDHGRGWGGGRWASRCLSCPWQGFPPKLPTHRGLEVEDWEKPKPAMGTFMISIDERMNYDYLWLFVMIYDDVLWFMTLWRSRLLVLCWCMLRYILRRHCFVYSSTTFLQRTYGKRHQMGPRNGRCPLQVSLTQPT